MHDTNPFLEQYEDAVTTLYKELRKLKFPVAKLFKWKENPTDERFWRDPTEDDYTYEICFSVWMHKDDEESVGIDFKMYCESPFSDLQYYELEIKVDGTPLRYAEHVDEFITLLKTKGTIHYDIHKFLLFVKKENKERRNII